MIFLGILFFALMITLFICGVIFAIGFALKLLGVGLIVLAIWIIWKVATQR